jgi:hypothetical protein
VIEIRGRFYRDDDGDSLPNGAGVYIRLRHDDPTVVLRRVRDRDGNVLDDPSVKAWAPMYVELYGGVIPRLVRIPANDEIEPAGSYYTITASYPTGGGQRRTFYESEGPIILQGAGPVDIGMPPRERTLTPIPRPERRPMPAAPQGVNRVGFFGGVIQVGRHPTRRERS